MSRKRIKVEITVVTDCPEYWSDREEYSRAFEDTMQGDSIGDVLEEVKVFDLGEVEEDEEDDNSKVDD